MSYFSVENDALDDMVRSIVSEIPGFGRSAVLEGRICLFSIVVQPEFLVGSMCSPLTFAAPICRS
jgi:hypothetical protein